MTAEHTPGPWRVSSAKPTKTRGIDILGGYSMFVAHVPVAPAYYTEHPEQANARLIAAAPELLEIAKRVAQHFDHLDAPLGELARAAIAKVEGRA